MDDPRGRTPGSFRSLYANAEQRCLLVCEALVFCDEGFSGATLTRPALERLRDRAAEGAFALLLCHAPDRSRAEPNTTQARALELAEHAPVIT